MTTNQADDCTAATTVSKEVLSGSDSVPTITVCTLNDKDTKRFSTGSDYTGWNKDQSRFESSTDVCPSGRGILEPRLSIQSAHLNTQSSSSLNLLDSASQAGCIVDTDIENCDRQSDNVLEPSETCHRPAHRPSIEETKQRILEWLDTVPQKDTVHHSFDDTPIK